jgi:hypothetical protein
MISPHNVKPSNKAQINLPLRANFAQGFFLAREKPAWSYFTRLCVAV